MSQTKLMQMLMTGDWSGAEAMLRPVAEAPSANIATVYNWGKVLIELHRGQEAITALNRVVEAEPNHLNGWFELGRAAVLCEAFETAFRAFGQARALDPGDADTARNLGRLALRLGRWEVAGDAWHVLPAQDPEARIALYRIAAETRDPNAVTLRAALMADHPDRAAVITGLVRVAKGTVPLDLGNQFRT